MKSRSKEGALRYKFGFNDEQDFWVLEFLHLWLINTVLSNPLCLAFQIKYGSQIWKGRDVFHKNCNKSEGSTGSQNTTSRSNTWERAVSLAHIFNFFITTCLQYGMFTFLVGSSYMYLTYLSSFYCLPFLFSISRCPLHFQMIYLSVT